MRIVLFQIRTRTDLDQDAYSQEFERMLELVSHSPGFVSIDSYLGEDGTELAVARFASEEAIEAWRDQPDHVRTRRRGREEFFDAYHITIADVSREYRWSRESDQSNKTIGSETAT